MLQVKQILERHLVLGKEGYTMADLKRFANETVRLPTVRDTLNIRVRDNGVNGKKNTSFLYMFYIIYLIINISSNTDI